MSDDELTDLRRTRIGVVFQFFNLLPNITALENVALPLRGIGAPRRTVAEKAEAALARVNLGDRAHHRPIELSGGEMQRVAIARALAIDPAIILADEPTGNLDSTRARELLALLREMTDHDRLTVLLVTHDHELASGFANRIIMMKDGKVVND